MNTMKTQITRNWRSSVISASVLLAVLFPVFSEAGSLGSAGPQVQALDANCERLDLSGFLEAQGTGAVFFPPVKNYVGWVDGPPTTFALVDYAGLANEYLAEENQALGTTVEGRVIQCEQADGRAQIIVSLSTSKALGFAQSIADLVENGFDFLATPTIFGAKAQDVVVDGAEPATGTVTFSTTFTIARPVEDPALLPDLVDVLVDKTVHYAPVTLSFNSLVRGRCADGRRAYLVVDQEAATNDQKKLIFSLERVEAVDYRGRSCGE